jgi:hypothetical protein
MDTLPGMIGTSAKVQKPIFSNSIPAIDIGPVTAGQDIASIDWYHVKSRFLSFQLSCGVADPISFLSTLFPVLKACSVSLTSQQIEATKPKPTCSNAFATLTTKPFVNLHSRTFENT